MIGMLTKISESCAMGWVESSQVAVDRPLRLFINGRKSELVAAYAPSLADKKDDEIVKFAFESAEGFSNEQSFEISVLTSDNYEVAPGSIWVGATHRRSLSAWSLQDIDEAVHSIITAQVALSDIQHSVGILSSWFGHAVDRMNAIIQIDSEKTTKIADLLRKYSGERGAIQHLIGIITEKYEKIVLEFVEKSKVTIVIPVFNKFEMTYDCVKSLVAMTSNVNYEVVLIDDCSSDETMLAKLVFEGGINVTRSDSNLGFVEACNLGAINAKGDFLLFLNNDTVIKSANWLLNMLDTFSNFENVGVVGARLTFSDGVLQDCGGIVWRDASAWNYGRYASVEDWRYRYARDADYVSGACLMIEKQLFKELNHFDVKFAPAYYEDTDLCFRVRERGRRVIIQPAATIIHLEGQSNGTDTRVGLKRYQLKNQKKFLERWSHVLKHHQHNGQNLAQAINRYARGNALFIDDSMLTPNQDAGSNAALQHIKSLQRLGFNVVFIPADNMSDIKPYSVQLEAQGVECIYAPFYNSVEDFLKKDSRKFDVIYLHRFSNAARYLYLCRRLRDSSRIIYNVADIHSLREERAAAFSDVYEPNLNVSSVDPRLELALMRDADVTIVHSCAERDYLRDRGIWENVRVVPWAVPVQKTTKKFEDRVDIAFIGGFRHAPNVDAVLWFFRSIFYLMTKNNDAPINFKIIGSNMPDEFRLIKHPNVEVVGFVDDLSETLSSLRLTIAPLRFGAGIKGKVLTSMAHGVPCVMSRIAAEGIPLSGELKEMVVDDAVMFANTIRSVYSNRNTWMRASELGKSMIESRFSESSVDSNMRLVIS